MRCTIVIVSWNVRPQLEQCLRSIGETTDRSTVDVFVVDNNSSDNSSAMVREEFPWVRLIANKKNNGFARACNQAIAQTTDGDILLLNPDTELTPQSLHTALAVLHDKPQVGILGCQLRYPDGTIQSSVRQFPDLFSHVMIMLKLHNFFPSMRAVQRYYMNSFDYTRDAEVPQVMGAFFLIRRDVLRTVGLLDEGFYIWYEEVDYCARAFDYGWQTYYTTQATVLHHKGASFTQRSPIRLQMILNHSIIRYFRKHGSRFAVAILSCIYPISIMLAVLQQIVGARKRNRDL